MEQERHWLHMYDQQTEQNGQAWYEAPDRERLDPHMPDAVTYSGLSQRFWGLWPCVDKENVNPETHNCWWVWDNAREMLDSETHREDMECCLKWPGCVIPLTWGGRIETQGWCHAEAVCIADTFAAEKFGRSVFRSVEHRSQFRKLLEARSPQLRCFKKSDFDDVYGRCAHEHVSLHNPITGMYSLNACTGRSPPFLYTWI